jgi:hypothetical protein
MKTRLFIVFSCVALSVLIACKKEAGSTQLKVRLTDAPASFEEVNIDLREVLVKMDNDSSAWISMQTAAGVYNLLGLQNGVDTLISEAILPAGHVKEIRLVLGDDNNIKAGGETYPLVVPSGSASGLKIKVDKALRGSVDSVLIDFDAALSVRSVLDGYKLRPVLRVIE